MKFDFGRPEVHFEAWHHSGSGRMEVGLHLEGPPELNRRGFDLLRARMTEIKRELPRAELEPWDRGWCRLYETFPAPVLSGAAMADTAARLAAYMRTLQPIVETLPKGR